jgi:SpoVK/Ycf46/Vps4 family AAA+-type ATPase
MAMMSLPDQRTANLFHEVAPKRKFSDLILSDEILQICRELVQEQHKADLLRTFNLEPRHRVLLIGPPGNGKTSLAEAIAEALKIPLLAVRYESTLNSLLGQTAANLQNLFDYISTRRCVLFFDEFETLSTERGNQHEVGEIKRVVSSLLLQIDALPSHVVAIGATNHQEMLDRAVWRRFQIRMTLPNPTLNQLTNWFERFANRINVPLGHDPAILAEQLQSLNFAEIEEFGATVLRKYVLGQPHAVLKDIISQTMRIWTAISVIADQQDFENV